MAFFDRVTQPIETPIIEGVFTVDTLPVASQALVDRYARVTTPPYREAIISEYRGQGTRDTPNILAFTMIGFGFGLIAAAIIMGLATLFFRVRP